MLDIEELLRQLKKYGTMTICNDAALELIERLESAEELLADSMDERARLQDKLQAAESKLKLIDGVSQDAIDGGWTSYGLSSYAKSLEKNNAELYARLNSLINPCEQTQQSNELYDDTHAKLNIEKVDHTFTHRFKNAMLDK